MFVELAGAKSVPPSWGCYRDAMLEQACSALKPFYQAGFSALDNQMADAPFVALDIETTGFDAVNDRIVSIGLVEFDLQKVALSTARHWLVNPGALSDSSVVVHGITHSEVLAAPPVEQVISEVLRALQGRIVVVHYRSMEREFFRQLSLRLWQQPWLFPIIDTFSLECAFMNQSMNVWQRVLRKPLPSLRLPDARQRYGLPNYENHNALIDAIATAELLQAIAQRWDLKERLVSSLVV
jgi:DNA polymerase III subunit epsilon